MGAVSVRQGGDIGLPGEPRGAVGRVQLPAMYGCRSCALPTMYGCRPCALRLCVTVSRARVSAMRAADYVRLLAV